MRQLLVDGMNVIGTRPDGWWRDRDAAVRRLVARLGFAAAAGGQITVVFDGPGLGDLPEGAHDGVIVFYGGRGGPDAADDRIVELVEHEPDPSVVEVVTADRRLRDRVTALGARVQSPRGLLERLDHELDVFGETPRRGGHEGTPLR